MRRRLRAALRAASWMAARCDDAGEWCGAVLRRIEREGRMTRRERAIVGAVHAVIIGTGLGGLWLLGWGVGWW